MATTPSAVSQFAGHLERIGEGLGLVERAMREQLASQSQVVEVLGDYVLGAGGKRIRPSLLLFAADLCGYTGPRCVQIAAAVELLHTATLLHDDVVDLATLRRGRTAANAVWGNRRSILVGDFLYARASAMIVEDGDLDVLTVFTNTIRRMAEGELLQLQRSFDPSIGESHYYDVIERKSASLLSSACEAGSILGGVTRAERRRLAEYGRELGLAFQIRDDSLDYAGGAGELGKAPQGDLREGKVTLPLLLTLKRATAQEREVIGHVLKRAAELAWERVERGEPATSADGLDVEPVLALVERYHGVADAMRRAADHVARAEAAIAPFPEGPAKQALLAAAAYAVARDH
jgi:octaprenyl-diphosphate synthase